MILSHAGERIQPSKDITIKYSNQDSIQQYNFFFHCITVWKILERSVCAIASCNADYIGECARCLNGWGNDHNSYDQNYHMAIHNTMWTRISIPR